MVAKDLKIKTIILTYHLSKKMIDKNFTERKANPWFYIKKKPSKKGQLIKQAFIHLSNYIKSILTLFLLFLSDRIFLKFAYLRKNNSETRVTLQLKVVFDAFPS